MPETKKVEPSLQDGPGIFRQKAGLVLKNFLTQPINTWVDGDMCSVGGFREGGLSFLLSVEAFGIVKDDNWRAEIGLRFRSDTDITLRAEWCVSIVDPTGKVLTTSKLTKTDFIKDKIEYSPDQLASVDYGRIGWDDLIDDTFGQHSIIKEKGWLFDGNLHLVADIRFKVLEGGYAKSCPAMDPFLSALRRQLDSPMFPDFTLISADEVQIKTHKLLLVLQSPVFCAMFENDLEEARTGICKIEDANAESIKAMLAFLVGVEPEEWTFELAKGLFELADKYELTHLLEKASMELVKGLTTKNLPDVLLLAHQHSAKGLLNEAFEFLEDNLDKATLDGVLVRLVSADMPEMLFQEWHAHWYRRKEGVDLKPAE